MRKHILILYLFCFLAAASLYAEKASDITPEGVSLDGKDDILVVLNSGNLNPKQFTAEAWVYVNENRSVKSSQGHHWQFIIFKKNCLKYYNEGFALFYDDEYNRFAACVSSALGEQKCIATEFGSVEIRKWHHVALTADSKEMKLYMDGVLQNSMKTGFPLDFDKQPIMFGGRELRKIDDRYNDIFEGKFNGRIDEVKLWDYCLSADEIRNSMNAGADGSERGLIAYYPFDNCNEGIYPNIGRESLGALLLNNPDCPKPGFLLDNGAVAGAFDIEMSVNPNPASDNASLSISMLYDGIISLSLYNSSGVEVRKIFDGYLRNGKYIFPVRLTGNDIPAGIYYCMAIGPAGNKICTMPVIK